MNTVMNLNVLRALRVKRGLTQGDLAQRLGVSLSLIHKVEAGKIQPCIDKVVMLADLYRVSIDNLVERKNYGRRKKG